MPRGVTFITPRSIIATPLTVQRLLERLEAALASTAADHGASMIGVEDAAGTFTGTDLESVLIELYAAATSAGSDTFTDTNNFYAVDQVGAAFVALGTALGGVDSTTRNYTESNVVADNQSYFASLDALDMKFGDIASVANGEGASLIGIEDAATIYTAANVEAALAEVKALADAALPADGSVVGATGAAQDFGALGIKADTVAESTGGAGVTVGGVLLKAASIPKIVTTEGSILTIAGGVVNTTQSFHLIDTEGAAASDDIDTINGLSSGQIAWFTLADPAHNVVLKHGVGNIFCSGGFDITLDGNTDIVLLIMAGVNGRAVGMCLADLAGGGLGAALNSAANGQGASRIRIEDAAALLAATNVEAALAEIAGDADAAQATATASAATATNAAATGLTVDSAATGATVDSAEDAGVRNLGTPATASTTAVHAGFAGNDASNDFPGPFTNPDVPRSVTVTFAAGWDGGNVTVSGQDGFGNALAVVVASNPAGTSETDEVFATVTSATKSAVGVAADAASIGTGTKLGWGSSPGIMTGFAVGILSVDGVTEAATWDANGAAGRQGVTPTTAPNGAHAYRAWFPTSHAHNVTDAGHAHAVTDPQHTH